jgi:hypothetical protein
MFLMSHFETTHNEQRIVSSAHLCGVFDCPRSLLLRFFSFEVTPVERELYRLNKLTATLSHKRQSSGMSWRRNVPPNVTDRCVRPDQVQRDRPRAPTSPEDRADQLETPPLPVRKSVMAAEFDGYFLDASASAALSRVIMERIVSRPRATPDQLHPLAINLVEKALAVLKERNATHDHYPRSDL